MVTKPESGADPRGFRAMITARRAQAKAAAALIQPDWTERQVAALSAKLDELQVAIGKNLELLTRADDPRWGRWFAQCARAEYVKMTLDLISEYKHWLCCAVHGITGVTEIPPEHYEGLAWHGMEGPRIPTEASRKEFESQQYERYCDRCADLTARIAELTKEWKR